MKFITKYFKKQKLTTTLDVLVVQYENPTDKVIPARLFGFNDFFAEPNFGNGDLNVKNIQQSSHLGYNRLIAESQTDFVINKLRIQSSNLKALQTTLSVVKKHANGNEYSRQYNLSLFKDAYQFQADIIDFCIGETKINGSTYLEFDVEPNATIVVSVYKQETKLVSYRAYKKHYLENNERRLAPVYILSASCVKWGNFIQKIKQFFSKYKTK